MARSSVDALMPVGSGIATEVDEYQLLIRSKQDRFAVSILRDDASMDEYRAALARIADTINQHLDATAPKPEPIKVGDRVSVVGNDHKGMVLDVDDYDGTALIKFDHRIWRWIPLANVTKVPA